MEKQYYGVLDKKSRVSLPKEIKKETNLKENDVLRICTFDNLIVMEKVNLKDRDIGKRLKECLHVEQMPMDGL